MWSLGFRGRCLLAGAGIQANFVFLANWALVYSVSLLRRPGNKEVCKVYQRETKQNKAQSSTVLLIQMNDLHVQMKLVLDRLLALGGQEMRTNEGLCPSGEVIDSLLVLAPHIYFLQVFPLFCKFSLVVFLLPQEACRSKGWPRGFAFKRETH